jgi:hypothetical protein
VVDCGSVYGAGGGVRNVELARVAFVGPAVVPIFASVWGSLAAKKVRGLKPAQFKVSLRKIHPIYGLRHISARSSGGKSIFWGREDR